MRNLNLPLIACIAGCALACATPTEPKQLVDAQAAYDEASANPDVQANASVELLEAKRALDRAEEEWREHHETGETEHLAYLAARRVQVAELSAAQRKSMAEREQLTAQRAKGAQAVVSAAESARAEADAARADAELAAAREQKLREELADLQARETERGLELTLGDILFDVDQSTLKPGAMQNLYRLVTFLKEYPDRAVLIEGHTDSTGTDSYNLTLSERRADAVRSFLVSNGIPPERVLSRGYGKDYPVAGNESSAGRQQNRRVEVVILRAGDRPEARLRSSYPASVTAPAPRP
jgi:outer membrane protein OmpA-like peptidoglycan-associated protein